MLWGAQTGKGRWCLVHIHSPGLAVDLAEHLIDSDPGNRCIHLPEPQPGGKRGLGC